MATWALEERGRVAVLTFTRPPRNWMDFASMGELADHLERLGERRADISVVLLTGGVDGYFVAHADLEDLAAVARGEPGSGDPRSWGRALRLLGSIPQPTVAAVDGQAWGGGCEICLACTMRVGSERAHLAQPEVNVGIIPGAGGTQRLPRLVGAGIGAELVMSGRVVEATEAHRIGLLNAVLPAAPGAPFVDAAVAWCERISRQPPAAVFAAKRAVLDGLDLPLGEGLALEGRLFLELNASEDARTRNAAARDTGVPAERD